MRDAHDTADSLLADEVLMQCIDLWIEHGRIENIGCERLLALIRSSTPEQTPTAEGRVTLGFLTQLLQAHLKFGGLDPRSTTRQDLLDHGMDIHAGSSKDGLAPNPCAGLTFVPEGKDSGASSARCEIVSGRTLTRALGFDYGVPRA